MLKFYQKKKQVKCTSGNDKKGTTFLTTPPLTSMGRITLRLSKERIREE